MQNLDVHISARLAWAIANSEACATGFLRIEPIHFFLAVLKIIETKAFPELKYAGVPQAERQELQQHAEQCQSLLGLDDETVARARRSLKEALEKEGEAHRQQVLHRSKHARLLFDNAVGRALDSDSKQLNVLHLAQELIANPPDEARPYLAAAEQVPQVSAKSMVESPPTPVPEAESPKDKPLTTERPQTPLLDSMGRDLSDLARRKKLPPIVGRAKEITAMARHLQRTTKRNVLIIGEAGVGKTAIVEGLAQRLAAADAPDFLSVLRILQINVSDLIAGTKYRGDMEERLRKLIEEATSDPNLVLFFDEIHLMVSGSSEMDTANILKPALTREDFRCIGATTVDEYEKYLKDDPAFVRRFQLVRVEEPSPEEAVQICSTWARRIEERQGILFTEAAIAAAVKLSDALIKNRSLPDKAIDLLENAATSAIVSTLTFHPRAISKETPTIDVADIEATLEEQFGVTVTADRTLNVQAAGEALRSTVVGQNAAIDEILNTLSALGAAAEDSPRPMGIFMFTGPTGVGKTLAAECLGQALFGQGFVRFNMKEYKESHDISRMTGAPPGFIGHQHSGALFRFVEVHPRGLILLDEVEKAHPDILDYFLQIFDKGEALDSRGRAAHFRNHLFVMTSNVGTPAKQKRAIGFGEKGEPDDAGGRAALEQALAARFRREFLGRIDRIVDFEQFKPESYALLLDNWLGRFLAMAERVHGLRLVVRDEVKSELAALGAKQDKGARGFVRMLEQMFHPPFKELISSAPPQGDIKVELEGDAIRFAAI